MGWLRFIFALIVAFAHLDRGRGEYLAHYAVYGFFVLSGYLITRILVEVYPFTCNGLGKFALNRFLRLYPAYFVIFAASLALAHLAPPEAVAVSPGLKLLPASVHDWGCNITMFCVTWWRNRGFNSVLFDRVVDNSWSLTIELWFYLLMALGLARCTWIVALWFLAGIVQVSYGFYKHYDFYSFYLPITAGLLPFSAGSALYYIRRHISIPPEFIRPWMLAAIVLWIMLIPISHWHLVDPYTGGLYVSLACSALLIFGLTHYENIKKSERIKNMERLLGDLSYPIFLSHWMVAIAMKWLFHGLNQRHGSLFLASLPFILVLSWVLVMYLERPINGLRARIRPQTPARLSHEYQEDNSHSCGEHLQPTAI